MGSHESTFPYQPLGRTPAARGRTPERSHSGLAVHSRSPQGSESLGHANSFHEIAKGGCWFHGQDEQCDKCQPEPVTVCHPVGYGTREPRLYGRPQVITSWGHNEGESGEDGHMADILMAEEREVKHKEEPPTRPFVWLCGVIAVVLAVVGVSLVLMTDLEGAKGGGARAVNHAVKGWEESYRGVLAQTRWWLRTQHGTVELKATAEVAASQVDPQVDPFSPLTFQLDDLIVLLPENATAGVQLEPLDLNLVVEDEGQGSVLRVGDVSLLQRREDVVASWKTCRHQQQGIWTGPTCISFDAVARICVKVDKDRPTGKWSLDYRYGGDGCSPQNGWGPIGLRHVPVEGNESLPTISTAGPLSVRSAHDPYLLALNITEGSLVFGVNEISQLATGLILLSLAAVLAVPPAFLLTPVAWRRYQRARERWGRYEYVLPVQSPGR